MYKQKVRAFTLLEVTITMLISALVIGITYTSYSIVIKSHASFNKKNNETADLISLDHLIKKDFDRAETILKDTDGITIGYSSNLIKYKFDLDFIVRIAGRIDTFKMLTKEVQTSFEGIPVNEIQETEELNRIDELSFTLLIHNEEIHYHYYKLYSSANLIQRNPNAGN